MSILLDFLSSGLSHIHDLRSGLCRVKYFAHTINFRRREGESMNAISGYCRKICDVASVHQSVSVCSVVGSGVSLAN